MTTPWARIAEEATPTALYRLYDAEDELLYIGISEAPEKRWAHHASEKSWWPQVARKEIRWFPTRKEAEAAEARAIATERTPHNVAGSPWAPKPRELGPDEMLVSEASANLTAVLNRVRLQDRMVILVRPDRKRSPWALLLPPDFADLIEACGGLDEARAVLKERLEISRP
jgi:predicted GIY-YIG superfamily endonuclease